MRIFLSIHSPIPHFKLRPDFIAMFLGNNVNTQELTYPKFQFEADTKIDCFIGVQ